MKGIFWCHPGLWRPGATETTDLRLYWHLSAPPSPMNRCKLVLVSESAKKMWGEGDFLVSPWPVKARGNWDNWSASVLASRCSTITYEQISFDLFGLGDQFGKQHKRNWYVLSFFLNQFYSWVSHGSHTCFVITKIKVQIFLFSSWINLVIEDVNFLREKFKSKAQI